MPITTIRSRFGDMQHIFSAMVFRLFEILFRSYDIEFFLGIVLRVFEILFRFHRYIFFFLQNIISPIHITVISYFTNNTYLLLYKLKR